MALPPGITPKTVTVGIASFFDGSLAEGTATITAPVNVVHTPSNRPIFSSQMSHRFVDGETSFNLAPTDAPGLNRVDWTYKLNVVISGALVQPEPIYFTLPTAGPDVIDLDGLVTVPSSAGTPISVDVLTTEDFTTPDSPLRVAVSQQLADETTAGTSAFAVAQRAAFVRRRHVAPLYATAPSDFRQIPVVMLHNQASLSDATGQLKNYKAWGYETIFFSQLVDYLRTGDATGLPEKPICITVDDGGLSNYQYLYPALVEQGMKATFFLVPAYTNGDITQTPQNGPFVEAPFTWANAREMFASGRVEFQSHTLTHGSMRLLSGPGQFAGAGEGAGADFLAAKALIETNVPGSLVKYTACPYGVINQAALDSLAAAGCLGHRITAVGKDNVGIYDGSGPFGWVTPGTDPMLVPVADSANASYIRRANKFGEADRDGNMFENGRMLATQRGITLPTGWTFTTATALPQSGGTGPVLRGFGTGIATGAYHTDLIPVGLYNAFAVDWWLQATSVPTNGARCVIEGYREPTDASPVRTLTDQDSSTAWKRKRWNLIGYPDVAWIKVRFEVPGATASSEMLIWDVKVRRHRTVYSSGL